MRLKRPRSPLCARRHFRSAQVRIIGAESVGEVQKYNKLSKGRLGNLDASLQEFVIGNSDSVASIWVSVVYKEIRHDVEAATWHFRGSPIHLAHNFGARATGLHKGQKRRSMARPVGSEQADGVVACRGERRIFAEFARQRGYFPEEFGGALSEGLTLSRASEGHKRGEMPRISSRDM